MKCGKCGGSGELHFQHPLKPLGAIMCSGICDACGGAVLEGRDFRGFDTDADFAGQADLRVLGSFWDACAGG